MEKKKYWVLLPAAALILAAFVWAFWDVLVMYAAPQIPLGRALESAFVGLEARVQDSPLPILLEGYDENGHNTVSVELSREGAPIGRLQVQTDLEEGKYQIQGTFPDESRLPSLGLYLDQSFAAVTSELLRGGYYGITYETFSQDLRSIPLVSLLVPASLKGEWEDSVRELKAKMEQTVSLPAIPQIPREQLKTALLGLWALRPEVTLTDLAPEMDSHGRPGFQVTYRVEGETAKFLWERVFQKPYSGSEQITLSFYLYQKALVKLELNAVAGGVRTDYALTLGPDARQDDLVLTMAQGPAAQSYREIRTVLIGNSPEGERYTIRTGDQNDQCQWNSQTGDMVLSLPEKEPISLNLSQAGEGFRIQSSDLGRLLKSSLFENCHWDVTVTKGSGITTPEFKNLDQWSLNDLVIFLNGIWSALRPDGV